LHAWGLREKVNRPPAIVCLSGVIGDQADAFAHQRLKFHFLQHLNPGQDGTFRYILCRKEGVQADRSAAKEPQLPDWRKAQRVHREHLG
jgi:hypothetical protein